MTWTFPFLPGGSLPGVQREPWGLTIKCECCGRRLSWWGVHREGFYGSQKRDLQEGKKEGYPSQVELCVCARVRVSPCASECSLPLDRMIAEATTLFSFVPPLPIPIHWHCTWRGSHTDLTNSYKIEMPSFPPIPCPSTLSSPHIHPEESAGYL